MKNILMVTTILVLGSFLLFSCGGKDEAPAPTSNLPEWIDNPPTEGGISAVGDAKVGAAGRGFAKNEAAALGRDEIARQLGVKVNNMIKSFVQVTGVGDDQSTDKATSQVSKQVSSQLLSGSKITKTFQDRETNTMYVLVVLDPQSIASAKTAMKEAVKTSYKNDKALWQQFQAQKADQSLDKEIEKEFSGQ